MTHDYGLYLREEIYGTSGWQPLGTYDLFLSAFNFGERTSIVFDQVSATRKIWLVHDEYGLQPSDLPTGEIFHQSGTDESTYCRSLIDGLISKGEFVPETTSVCVDITGILRPHLMFLALYFKRLGVPSVDFIYAEPKHYTMGERTPFSTGSIYEVRPVRGFEGSLSSLNAQDFLVLGMGYDDRLLAAVAETKDKADKHQVFGLPSLRADMYQQSVLRSRKAADELGDPGFSEHNRSFAPANDPFGTAAVLSDLVARRLANEPSSSILLCPLGTKAQALGFAVYHMLGCQGNGARLIFPFSEGYSPKTGSELARAWLYRLELQ